VDGGPPCEGAAVAAAAVVLYSWAMYLTGTIIIS